MKKKLNTPINTVRDPELSRWQSTIEQYLKEKNPNLSIGEIRQLPMMQGSWQHLQSAMKQEIITVSKAPSEATNSIAFHAYASQYFLNLTKSLKDTSDVTLEAITAQSSVDDDWPYSTGDTWGWAECVVIYYSLYLAIGVNLQYRDYQSDGDGNIDYSLINWKIPSDGGKVLMIGDWGTSNEDASAMLQSLVNEHDPDCIVHLGDIYYSGTENECTDNFYNIIRNTIGTTIPVFTIPGNHEYYSYGYGFYNLLDTMNTVSYTHLTLPTTPYV